MPQVLRIEYPGGIYHVMHAVWDYVHLNAGRVRRLSPEQKLRDYAWTRWPEPLKPAEERPRWLGELGKPRQHPLFHPSRHWTAT